MKNLINVFLVDGDTFGRKIFEFADGSMKLSVFPRNNIIAYNGENVLEQNCVYFLVNMSTKKIYIGQSVAYSKYRQADHNYNKEFWDTLFIFTSPGFDNDSSLIEEVEDIAISAIKKQKEWEYFNKKGGDKRGKRAFLTELCNDYFKSIEILSNTAGCYALPYIIKSNHSTNSTQTKNKKRNEVSKDIIKTQEFCLGNSIVRSVGPLLENFAIQYLNLHSEVSLETFVTEFNKKANYKYPFYMFEKSVKELKVEKQYRSVEIRQQKLFVLRSCKEIRRSNLCSIMTELGIKTVQVDPNKISIPCGLYEYKTNRAHIVLEVFPDRKGWFVKKDSYYIDKEGNKIHMEEGSCYATQNRVIMETIGQRGPKEYFISLKNHKNLQQIEDEMLLEQAKKGGIN